MKPMSYVTRRKRHHREFELQKQIWEWLAYQGIWAYIDWQPIVKKEWLFLKHKSSTGCSDIIGIFNEKFLAIEVKVGRAQMTKKQVEFQNRVNENGGIAFCARSIRDVAKQLKIRTGVIYDVTGC